MKHLKPGILHIIILIAFMAGFKVVDAAITVDSIFVSTSSCPNNGTATVHATSTNSNAVFLYNIVSGPVTYLEQNDSTFYSLYPGSYTGWVHDVNSFDSTQFTFSVSGSYQSPVVSISGSSPLCLNSNTGQIMGHVQAGTGLAPYQWQMYSPYTGPEQQSDTFNNLGTGSYIIRLTDACNVSRAASLALDTGGTGLQSAFANSNANYISCGTVVFTGTFSVFMSKAYLAYTLSETTSTGTVTKQIYPQVEDTTNSIPPLFYFTDTITGVEFGGPFIIRLSDICDSAITFQPTTFQPFVFYFESLTDSCGSTEGTMVTGNPDGAYTSLGAYDNLQLSVTVQNAQTLQVVDSFTTVYSPDMDDGCISCPRFQQQPSNENFILTVTDGCGDTSAQTFNWPQSYPLSCRVEPSAASCLDSNGTAYFLLSGFGSTVNITLLSGPPVAESSNPLFAYQTQMVYPVSINGLMPENNEVSITNLPAGFYNYTISDLCGHTITDTFAITDVQHLFVTAPVSSNCNGTSNINIIMPIGESYLYVYNLGSTDTVRASVSDYEQLVIYNSPPGYYAISVGFFNGYGTFIPGNGGCSCTIDTVLVPSYNDSIIKSTYTTSCNGDIYLIVVADTNNGPPPFQYEVLSGPQTFPLQSTGQFRVSAWGTYLVGALDSCGNEDTRYVTVDTGRILPVVRSGGLCAGSMAKLYDVSSPFFTYVWTAPDGQVYVGDTLVIYPLSDADTGVYSIKKIVQINGCRDSAYGSYRFIYIDTFVSSQTICAGQTAYLDGHPFAATGFYTDTLTGAYGCDSVNELNLVVLARPATNFYGGICTGDTVFFAGSLLTQTGAYHDTLTAVNGCDSIVSLYLTVYPAINVTVNQSICTGQTVQVGANVYSTTGLYTDTLSSAVGCDSIVALSLTVYEAYNTRIKKIICSGDSVQIGNNVYTTSGTYTDTLSRLHGCDSIVNLILTVRLTPVVTLTWDSLRAYLAPPHIMDYCLGIEPTIPLTGGEPTGGYYYGPYVAGDSLLTIPFNYAGPRNDTLYYSYTDSTTGCNAVATNIFALDICEAISQLADAPTVALYPNPTTGKLIIETHSFIPKSIIIYDDSGRLINTQAFKNEIDISALSSGVYFVEVSDSEGVVRKRVVKM